MRQIKFRGWNGRSMQPIAALHDNGIGALADGGMVVGHKEGHAIMQFTGINDINGVEIYEGDIVEVLCYFGTSGKHPKKLGPTIITLGQIIFDCGEFTYREPKIEYQKRIDSGNATDWYRGFCRMDECKVIGNIYQNPELLAARSEQSNTERNNI